MLPHDNKSLWCTKTKKTMNLYIHQILANKGKVLIVFITVYVFFYITFFHTSRVTHHVTNEAYVTQSSTSNYLIDTKGCRIPKFHPFDPSVSIFFEEEKSPLDRCHEYSFLSVNKNKIYLTELTKKHFKNKSLNCVYQAMIRDPNNSSKWADYEVELGEAQVLKFGEPLKDEFVKVECFIGNKSAFIDYLALVLLKPDVEKRCESASNKMIGADPLNVIIIAVDSTSKLNFLRHFPMTNGLLKTKLKPFEFHGHTKVADNTFVNIVPMMTGHFVAHYRNDTTEKITYYDDLDLVWKEFSALGYRTFFIEDSPLWGTFSYLKRGFKKPATDYYLRPFAYTVEKTKWRTKHGEYCFGHTSETEFFYGYLREFIRRMDKRPFFAFTFISRPTHDHLNRAGYVDRPTFELLQDLMESNVLNNSVLIFFSDHGIRFGEIRETFIGKIEERMPFMFHHYPEWFLKKHEHIRQALTINQRRLTTPFDMHKTLQDVRRLSSNNEFANSKQMEDSHGKSLFQEISPERTCSDSHIIPHWCTCHNHIKLDNTDSRVKEISEKIIATINKLTNSTSDTSLCMKQYLNHTLDAYVSASDKTTASSFKPMEDLYYLITVNAAPSDAIFEGTFRFELGNLESVGEISRINSYGNQSWCTEDHRLKKYCFCRSVTTTTTVK